jgi:hypothetical protein
MAHDEELQFRLAGRADAQAVADLHAASWRRYYLTAASTSFTSDRKHIVYVAGC